MVVTQAVIAISKGIAGNPSLLYRAHCGKMALAVYRTHVGDPTWFTTLKETMLSLTTPPVPFTQTETPASPLLTSKSVLPLEKELACWFKPLPQQEVQLRVPAK